MSPAWQLKALAALALAVLQPHSASAQSSEERWIESWGTALPLQPPPPPPAFQRSDAPREAPTEQSPSPSPFVPFSATLQDQTVRMALRVSSGGQRFRLEFANANGAQPVTFGTVHTGVAAEG